MMRSKVLMGMLVVLGLVMVANRVVAHHSAAGLFSRDEEVVLTGAVKVWRMVNPHPALVFDVKKDGGAVETWTATFNSVADVRRHGWTRTTFEEGNPVTVLGNPFFGAQKTIFALVVTTPDGKKHLMRDPQVNKEYAADAHKVGN
ncbi:MAG: DUF6152 family protein [Terriglobia bacterium]